jgi:hypothetical protein
MGWKWRGRQKVFCDGIMVAVVAVAKAMAESFLKRKIH